MGYFVNLYVAELEAAEGKITARTIVYGNHVGDRKAYLSFGEGNRPEGLFPYADGDIFSDIKLTQLPAYPFIEVVSNDSDDGLFEAGFSSDSAHDAVVFHLILPENFVPLRNREPFHQPTIPFVSRKKNRLRATYPVTGAGKFQFHIERLEKGRTLDSYDLPKLFHPDARENAKVSVEFNLGVLKIKFGT